MIRNLRERLKKILLRFSSIEYKINTIKSISINFQEFTNQIIVRINIKLSHMNVCE